jgi:phosphate transport system permease protein
MTSNQGVFNFSKRFFRYVGGNSNKPPKHDLLNDNSERFKQSFVEVIAMLACAIILLVLAGLIVFIFIQGGRYFLPMSTYQVTTYFSPDASVEFPELLNDDNGNIGVSVNQKNTFTQMPSEQAKMQRREYTLSHLSADDLTKSLQKKLANQYLDRTQVQPSVEVIEADELYLLTTLSGRRMVGEFVNLQEGSIVIKRLSELPSMQSTVKRLQQDLKDIQVQRLQLLHKEISELNDKQVSVATPIHQRKLEEFNRWQAHANNIVAQINDYKINLRLDNNEVVSIAISNVHKLYQPNKLTYWQAIGYSMNQVYVFLTDSPKQASTAGGVFPAIFGTLLMVIIMAVLVTPFGAISAIYLHEYAPDNKLTSVIRICVSNMAAVPSVVYGVFGLGFFVYTLGGSIDSLFYSQKLPSPTFGSPGLLWASLTMGILTLPVVIVATEEGLSRVPSNLRTGALALGATKYETIIKVVLPMASPGILTGVILAIARAAGEVAPLILVGAVKFAPTLPIDSTFPFVHLERQFMHLGVFIYDGAFHNQIQSQVSSLMFATCMLLLLIVILLNLSAIILRNKLRQKYERL